MPAPRVDRQTFLANLRQSGLVHADQMRTVAPRLPASQRGRVLARALVELGVLTRFQAEQLLAGRTHGFFLGPYRILEQIGQGGTGRVYKAVHGTLGRTVAIKVLAPDFARNERAQQLFQREVRAAGLLVHPNIVTAFDAHQVGDRCYLVLEYIDGPNLDQLVREQGPLPVSQACDFVRQVACGLQQAARMGMLHRDIKPANLLLQRAADATGHGIVKISDFGLARIAESNLAVDDRVGTILTREHSVLGTPDYLSPEQARDLHRTDIRSDLYSLGATFYFLLTGRVPFPGGNILEKLIRHNTEEPTPVEELRPEVPLEVAAIVRRLMAKRPEARFQTPEELLEALAPFAVSSPASWSGQHEQMSDDSAALVGTLPFDDSPTPLSLSGMASGTRLSSADVARQQRRLRVALFWALGSVGGMLAGAAALGWLWSAF